MTDIQALNAIITQLGGTTAYKYNIQAYNAWSVLQGGTGAYTRDIDALNAIDVLNGGSGGHRYNINALNSIDVAAGGTGGHTRDISALTSLGTLLNQKPSDFSNLSLWVKENTRNGLTLPDTITPGTNDVTIIPTHLYCPAMTDYASVADNGSLDIGSQDFTLCGWFKSETVDKTTNRAPFGKQVSNSQNGRYGMYVAQTTGYFYIVAQSSGGNIVIQSTVDATTAGWKFLLMDVNQTTKKVRFFIDGVQIGTDASFTGTFAALSNDFEFYINCANNTAGAGINWQAMGSYADIRVYHKLLTPTEQNTLFNRGYVSGEAAYWPCNSWSIKDVVGGFHMTEVGLDKTNQKYDSSGSRYCLDKGHSRFVHSSPADNIDLHLPYTYAGTPLSSPTVPTGYTHESDHAGDLLNHNLADSRLQFVGDEFDRSNVALFSPVGRTLFYVSTNATTKKQFHITELNKSTLNSFYLRGFIGTAFVKMTDNSVTERKTLKELFAYSTPVSDADYAKIQRYTGDDGISFYIDLLISDENILAQNGSKAVKFESSRYLKYSSDNGATWPISLDLNGVTTKILRVKIYQNGNIAFFSHTKAYYSTDNLATYHEATTVAADDGAFTPTTYDNFLTIYENPPIVIDGVEIDVWGTYSVNTGTYNDNINAWYSVDSGLTVKSFWKAGVSDPLLAVNHIHAISWNPNDNSFWLQTGDGTLPTDSSSWIKFTYDFDTDTWSGTIIKTSDNAHYWKTGGIAFHNGYMYSSSDNDANLGLWRNTEANTTDFSKFERIITQTVKSIGVWDDYNGVLLSIGLGGVPIFMISVDNGLNWFSHSIAGLPALGSTAACIPICAKNSNGWYCLEMEEDAEDITDFRGGKKLLLKIII